MAGDEGCCESPRDLRLRGQEHRLSMTLVKFPVYFFSRPLAHHLTGDVR